MELKDGTYRIGGSPVEDLAALAGTPVYVYDAGIIDRQVHRLRAAFTDIPLRVLLSLIHISEPTRPY